MAGHKAEPSNVNFQRWVWINGVPIHGAVIGIDIYQSIFSTSITGHLEVIETEGILELIPILPYTNPMTQFSRVTIKVVVYGRGRVVKEEMTREFAIYKVNDFHTVDPKGRGFVLYFTDFDTVRNYETICDKTVFAKTFGEAASKLMDVYVNGTSSESIFNKSSDEEKPFTFPWSWHPYDALTWIGQVDNGNQCVKPADTCPEVEPAGGREWANKDCWHCGLNILYKTLDGMRYHSIEGFDTNKILTLPNVLSPVLKPEIKIDNTEHQYDYNIIEFYTDQHTNNLQRLTAGGLSNSLMISDKWWKGCWDYTSIHDGKDAKTLDTTHCASGPNTTRDRVKIGPVYARSSRYTHSGDGKAYPAGGGKGDGGIGNGSDAVGNKSTVMQYKHLHNELCFWASPIKSANNDKGVELDVGGADLKEKRNPACKEEKGVVLDTPPYQHFENGAKIKLIRQSLIGNKAMNFVMGSGSLLVRAGDRIRIRVPSDRGDLYDNKFDLYMDGAEEGSKPIWNIQAVRMSFRFEKEFQTYMTCYQTSHPVEIKDRSDQIETFKR